MNAIFNPLSAQTKLPPLIIACLLATWFVWGSTYLAIKFTLESIPPFLGMGTRFIVAGGLLALWMRYVKQVPWPSTREWGNAAVLGCLMLGFGMGGLAYAEQSVSSGLAVAFIAVVPVMLALGNIAFGIFPKRLETAGIAVGLVGVVMLTQGAGFKASSVGLMALCFSCTAWSLGSLLSQRVKGLAMAPGAMGFASEMLGGGVVLLVMAALSGDYERFAAGPPVSVKAFAAWVYLVIFGSLIAFNAYMVLLARSSAAMASSYSFVNPIIAMLLGVSLGQEVVTGYEWGAAGVVLLGVVLLLRAKR